MNFHTHNALRLGDNMAQIHFMRKLAQAYPDDQFFHYARGIYLPQLIELTCDLPNLHLKHLEYAPPDSIDSWKNAGNLWQNHPLANDYGPFYVDFFTGMSRRMGLICPIKEPSDLLFDYPMIRKQDVNIEPFDWLIVNSQPMSGQFRGYNAEQFEALILELANKSRVVVTQKVNIRGVACTTDFGLSVTGIGNLSLKCHKILMVSTGPSWSTFNTSNLKSIDLRVILLDSERINIAPNTEHARNIGEATEILKGKGLL